jgi:uncharacterized protein (TIGR02001 family)
MRIDALNQRAASIAIGWAIAAPASLVAAESTITGNIGVVSKYVLGGITNNPENDGAALQGGFDYSHRSGLFAGYWGSSLDYGDGTSATGFENDFYGGCAFSAGPLKMKVGATYYLYSGVDDSNAPEAFVRAAYGPVSFSVKYVLDDVVWGNKGDWYVRLDYGRALPADFAFRGSLGYYFFDDSDPNEPGTIPTGTTTENSTFSYLYLTLSHPIINDKTRMSVTFIVGGKNRSGVEQKDTVVLGLLTTF